MLLMSTVICNKDSHVAFLLTMWTANLCDMRVLIQESCVEQRQCWLLWVTFRFSNLSAFWWWEHIIECVSASGMQWTTSVTGIIRRRFQLTRADTSAVHTSQPITLATTTNSHVHTTVLTVSVIATGHVASIPAKPAAFSAVITR